MEKTRESTVCPYCLSPIQEQEEYVLCPVCGVAHHAECWRMNGKCSVYGCDGWQAWSSDIAERVAPKLTGEIDLEADNLELAPRAYEGPVCMECGKPVRRGQLTCLGCRTKNQPLYRSCSATGVLFLAAALTLVTLLVKGLS